ncbi:MAG: hypothetical protein ACWA5R_09370 [bacterium]
MSASKTGLIIITSALAGALLMNSANLKAERQPTMRNALVDLKSAERKLERANNDKGGHRKLALVHVRSAIKEVNKGIKFDNRH